MLKKIGLGLLIVLIVIQFFQPKKNIAAKSTVQHIALTYQVPQHVEVILAKACYDCHSDNTRYPWYNNIQPVAWWLAHHIDEGKAELNFSQFGSYSKKKQRHKLEEVTEMVKDDHMPLSSYTWIHKDAKLTQDEKLELMNWADGLRAQITGE